MHKISHEMMGETMTIKIAVLGRGRMGLAIEQCIAEADDLLLSGVWIRDRAGNEQVSKDLQSDDLESLLADAQIAIDFTLPEVTEYVIQAASKANIPLVCGVSGLTVSQLQTLTAASASIPILHDRNMSLGIAVLQQMVQLAGTMLGEDFTAEIHETHHIHKIDAPSGTALQLGETLAASLGQEFDAVYHFDPAGNSTPAKGQIHYEVTRRDEVPGEHTVMLKSPHEDLCLTHRVDDRRVFAVGAIRAARWLLEQPSGLYNMQDLVNDSITR